MPLKIVPRGPVDLGGEQQGGNHGWYRHGRIQSVDQTDDGRQIGNTAQNHQSGVNPDVMVLMLRPDQKAKTLAAVIPEAKNGAQRQKRYDQG